MNKDNFCKHCIYILRVSLRFFPQKVWAQLSASTGVTLEDEEVIFYHARGQLGAGRLQKPLSWGRGEWGSWALSGLALLSAGLLVALPALPWEARQGHVLWHLISQALISSSLFCSSFFACLEQGLQLQPCRKKGLFFHPWDAKIQINLHCSEGLRKILCETEGKWWTFHSQFALVPCTVFALLTRAYLNQKMFIRSFILDHEGLKGSLTISLLWQIRTNNSNGQLTKGLLTDH